MTFGDKMMSVRIIIKPVLLILFSIFLLPSASAVAQQTDNGSLNGVVKDPNGAVIPNATITATHQETGFKRNVTASEEGRWTLTVLKLGKYILTVEAPGFKAAPRDVVVTASSQTVDLVLDVAIAPAEIVEVRTNGGDGGITFKSEQSAVTGATITGKKLEELPVAARTPFGTLSLETSVSADLVDPLTNGNGNPEAAINGNRPTSVGVLFNGVDATNFSGTGSLTENISPAPETVQEVTVLTSLYDASLGRSGGGSVQVVTRNGGNRFSGSAYIFAQNEKFNANDFFFNRDGIDRQAARRLEGGATLGGPIIKNKLFFFGGYQKTDAYTAYVPTGSSFVVLPEAVAFITDRSNPQNIANAFAVARGESPGQGGFAQPGCIFSSLYTPAQAHPQQRLGCINTLSPFYRLLTTRNPVTGDYAIPTLTAGHYERLLANSANSILIDPSVANRFPNGFPLTDRERNSSIGGNPLVRARLAVPATFKQDQFTTRLDYNLYQGKVQSNQLNATFFFANFPATEPFTDSTLASPFPVLKDDRNRTLAISDTHVFSPTLINEVRFGYFWLNNSRELDSPLLAPGFTNPSLNIPNPATAFSAGPSTLRCARQAGYAVLQDFSVCAPNDAFNKRRQVTYTYADNVTYSRGDHTLRFGVEYKRNAFDTNLPEEQGVELEKYENFGLQLLGYVVEGDTAFGLSDKEFRFNDFSYYMSDDYKLTSRLTLNLGLRWDLFGRPYEKNGRFTNFDPSLVTNPDDIRSGFMLPSNVRATGNAAIDSGLTGIARSKNRHTLNGEDLNNFAPRFGFALDLFGDSKTVLRGGYGIFYDRPSAAFINTVYSNYPFFREVEEVYGNTPFATTFNNLFRKNSPTTPFSSGVPFRIAQQSTSNVYSLYLTNDLVPGTPSEPFYAEPLEFRAVDRDLKTPLVQQWNLGIQREVGKNWVIEARYVGTRGQQLLLAVGFNQAYDLSDPSTPDFIFKRLNTAYEKFFGTGLLPTTARNERERGCGVVFGAPVVVPPSNFPAAFPFPVGPQCPGQPRLFDYNLTSLGLTDVGAAFIDPELRTPYLGFDPVDAVMLQSRGYSIYHAGQFNLVKRLSSSYSFNASYTFSKSIDIGSTDPGSTAASGRPDTPNLGLAVQGDQRNINNNRGLSDFDRPHRFTGSFTWELPFNKSKNKLLNGWQLSGFGQWQSGTPFSIVGSEVELLPISNGAFFQTGAYLGRFFDGSTRLARNPRRYVLNVGRTAGFLYNAAFGRPNIVSPELLLRRNCDDPTRCYFNTSQRSTAINDRDIDTGLPVVIPADPFAAFATAYGRFGNLGRNVLRGPSQKRVDLSLRKVFQFSEQTSLEFKWDVFNVFNFVNFANPNADMTDETDFGQITRTIGAPRVMQFGLKFKF
jgi:Carboxypeptidase regulatory-like domain